MALNKAYDCTFQIVTYFALGWFHLYVFVSVFFLYLIAHIFRDELSWSLNGVDAQLLLTCIRCVRCVRCVQALLLFRYAIRSYVEYCYRVYLSIIKRSDVNKNGNKFKYRMTTMTLPRFVTCLEYIYFQWQNIYIGHTRAASVFPIVSLTPKKNAF